MNILVRLHKSLTVFLFSLSLLVGCTHYDVAAPVVNGWQQSGKQSDYIVQQGDTLYSVAWAFDLDYRDLAAANHLQSPYTLSAGQRLTMTSMPPPPKTEVVQAPEKKKIAKVVQPIELPVVENKAAKKSAVIPSPLVKEKQVASVAKIKPAELPQPLKKQTQVAVVSKPVVQAKIPQPAKKEAAPTSVVQQTKIVEKKNTQISHPTKKQIQVATSSKKVATQNVKSWIWPTHGKIISNYSAAAGRNRGVDIAGKNGQSVFAAATGKVVYSGTGLRGYGKLLIIKHSDSYLSAYAFNQTLLVKEGDFVKVGKKIATMGHNDQGKTLLHFEIRKNGKPVNPLYYLSKST